jgi:hypothetical protein
MGMSIADTVHDPPHQNDPHFVRRGRCNGLHCHSLSLTMHAHTPTQEPVHKLEKEVATETGEEGEDQLFKMCVSSPRSVHTAAAAAQVGSGRSTCRASNCWDMRAWLAVQAAAMELPAAWYGMPEQSS